MFRETSILNFADRQHGGPADFGILVTTHSSDQRFQSGPGAQADLSQSEAGRAANFRFLVLQKLRERGHGFFRIRADFADRHGDGGANAGIGVFQGVNQGRHDGSGFFAHLAESSSHGHADVPVGIFQSLGQGGNGFLGDGAEFAEGVSG